MEIQTGGRGTPFSKGVISIVDIVCCSICATFFFAWICISNKENLFNLAVFCLSFTVVSLVSGRLLLRSLSGRYYCLEDFPASFLTGFTGISVALFLFAAISPFNIIANFAFIIGLVIVLWIILSRIKSTNGSELRDGNDPAMFDIMCVLITGLAATLLARDSFAPLVLQGEEVVVKPWVDAFIHSAYIRMLSDAQGASSLKNVFLANGPVPIYHYAQYMPAALLRAATGISSFTGFNSFMVPGSFFVIGLAAYALVKSCFGSRPALLASIGIYLPSAAYHGVNDKFLDFHWLISVSPGLGYGIAAMAISWALMFQAIRTRNLRLIVASYLLAVFSAMVKIHVFIPNAILLLIFPALFWSNIPLWMRIAGLTAGVGVPSIVIKLSQQFESLPLIRLDFSSTKQYLGFLIEQSANPWVKNSLLQIGAVDNITGCIMAALVVVFYGTFGVFGLLAGICMFKSRRSIRNEVLLFPIFVIITYLIMALGLAYDLRPSSGTFDELRHRPFVWAYFVVCLWSMSAGYFWLLSRSGIKGMTERLLLCAVLIACLASAYCLGDKLQIGPFSTVVQFAWVRMPSGLVKSADFLRTQASPDDLIQGSEPEPRSQLLLLSGLSDRQVYVAAASKCPWEKEAEARLAELQQARAFTDKEQIRGFFLSRGIKWYVLYPTTKVNWPQAIAKDQVYSSGGFRVYRFDQGSIK